MNRMLDETREMEQQRARVRDREGERERQNADNNGNEAIIMKTRFIRYYRD